MFESFKSIIHQAEERISELEGKCLEICSQTKYRYKIQIIKKVTET
jgi:hypothetical protein